MYTNLSSHLLSSPLLSSPLLSTPLFHSTAFYRRLRASLLSHTSTLLSLLTFGLCAIGAPLEKGKVAAIHASQASSYSSYEEDDEEESPAPSTPTTGTGAVPDPDSVE